MTRRKFIVRVGAVGVALLILWIVTKARTEESTVINLTKQDGHELLSLTREQQVHEITSSIKKFKFVRTAEEVERSFHEDIVSLTGQEENLAKVVLKNRRSGRMHTYMFEKIGETWICFQEAR